MTIDNRYEKHRRELLSMLEELEDMWDGHLGRIAISKHRIVLTFNDVQIMHSAP